MMACPGNDPLDGETGNEVPEGVYLIGATVGRLPDIVVMNPG